MHGFDGEKKSLDVILKGVSYPGHFSQLSASWLPWGEWLPLEVPLHRGVPTSL